MKVSVLERCPTYGISRLRASDLQCNQNFREIELERLKTWSNIVDTKWSVPKLVSSFDLARKALLVLSFVDRISLSVLDNKYSLKY